MPAAAIRRAVELGQPDVGNALVLFKVHRRSCLRHLLPFGPPYGRRLRESGSCFNHKEQQSDTRHVL